MRRSNLKSVSKPRLASKARPAPKAKPTGSSKGKPAKVAPARKLARADDAFIADIAEAMLAGDVIPFLGAGASIAAGLPSAKTLAGILLKELLKVVEFPDEAEQRSLCDNLAQVASFLALKRDSLTLERRLREAFAVAAAPGKLHKLLATVKPLELIVTTNYDDLIEQAFEGREPWILVDHGVPGELWLRGKGKWGVVEAQTLTSDHLDQLEMERLQGGPGQPGRSAGEKTPIIYKMHGNFDRADKTYDWFLITEEHYVDFLGRPETVQVPQMLATLMKKKNFLFLGYELKDWNVRVMLRKLAQTRGAATKVNSWAIVREATVPEKEIWRADRLEMLEMDLDEFADRLGVELDKRRNLKAPQSTQ